MPAKEDAANQVGSLQQVLVTTESYLVNVKLHLGIEIHLDVEL